jgi:CRP-like cAMP-binding protein
MAIKVCGWRGLQLRQNGVGYNPALEEVPRRLAQTLYALARGRALLYKRNQLDYGDIEFVSHIAYASMPEDRARIFQYLWEREGYPERKGEPLTISIVAKLLGCTYPTAERVVGELITLGVVKMGRNKVKTFYLSPPSEISIKNLLP